MQTKLFFICALLISMVTTHAQISKIQTFDEPTRGQLEMKNYDLDPEASGAILYERGNYTVDATDGYIRLIKEVHRKIKVFDAKRFDMAEVEIEYYGERSVKENIKGLTAITHNGSARSYVGETSIFDTDLGNNWYVKRFTFPDVQDGSILEYTYRIETPYFSNIGNWQFMHRLPTVYSELHIEIPGNYHYNRSLRGNRALDVNHAEIKKACFHLKGYKVPGDCEVATYAMKHVPAFKEEAYMLSEDNYIAALNFELAEVIQLGQQRKVYAKTWKSVEREIQGKGSLGRQLRLASYFKNTLPASILDISDDLERAKAIYYYIQSKMIWNEQIRLHQENRVKEAFENGVGNSTEINFALINALLAGGLDAKIMAISTRDRALPTKEHPVLREFNYALAFLEIDGEKYTLDATEKYSQFGVLPMRALNQEGRVFDFKKGSYWEPISSSERNIHHATLQLEVDSQGVFSGKITEMSSGQIALPKRRRNNLLAEVEVVKQKQMDNESFDISDYTIENKTALDKPYTETYTITLQELEGHEILFLFPFQMQSYFPENLFAEEKRQYPIDMGFPVIASYLVSIDLKDQYEVMKMPENRILKLPLNDGELSVIYNSSGSKINIRLNVRINTASFSPEAHQSLYEFFEMLTTIHSKEPIELKRI